MYIAVKGGEQAIEASLRLLDRARRGDPSIERIEAAQITEQLGALVDRVMSDAGVHDPELAAIAIRQARGDLIEATFLLRAYRTTLPRFVDSLALDTARMRVDRRVSAVFKDLPGGQLLGASFDYTQRLLDLEAIDGERSVARCLGDLSGDGNGIGETPLCPGALDLLEDEGLVEPARPAPGDPAPPDITRVPPDFPIPRAARLQMMSRSDEGWLLGMAYSTQRGYANAHPFAGDLRMGKVELCIAPEELGFPVVIGELLLTECQMVTQFTQREDAADSPDPHSHEVTRASTDSSAGTRHSPQFTRGYGLTLGCTERKAMSMALVDRAQRCDEFGERGDAPAQDAEFVLMHGDSVEASGFVQHLKLPHYVTFESELTLLRALRNPEAG